MFGKQGSGGREIRWLILNCNRSKEWDKEKSSLHFQIISALRDHQITLCLSTGYYIVSITSAKTFFRKSQRVKHQPLFNQTETLNLDKAGKDCRRMLTHQQHQEQNQSISQSRGQPKTHKSERRGSSPCS